MIATLIFIFLFSLLVALVSLGRASASTHNPQRQQLADKIDALLPQTQCGKCEFDGCRPYADSIASGESTVNRCPPGGMETFNNLRELLGQENDFIEYPQADVEPTMLAYIDEQSCIGCVKCIKACPVDAIVGAAKQMHTVIDALCTGCGLCLAPCPVDCISMQEERREIRKWVWEKPRSAGEVL